MSSYSTQQLADYTRKILAQKYSSKELRQEAFRGKFNTLVNSINSKLLTDAEQEKLTLNLAAEVISQLPRVTDPMIISLVPQEILANSRLQSFDILAYEKDMNKVANTVITKAADSFIRNLKKSAKKK